MNGTAQPGTNSLEIWCTTPTGIWRHVLAWLVLGALGILFYVQSFQGWGHPIIDLGRDLYLPSEILQGRVLYRDLIYNYGPVTPYLLAVVVSLAGDSLRVFEVFGILVGVASMAAVYVTLLRLGGVVAGSFAALLFLVLNFFAYSTWGCNFVLPYSYAATLSTAFALWSLYFLLHYLYGTRSQSVLAWSVVFLLAALFTKLEVGVAIALTHALSWWAHGISRKAISLILGSAALLCILLVAIFSPRTPTEHSLFVENLGRFAEGSNADSFFGLVAGLDYPFPRFLHVLRASIQLALLVLLGCLAASIHPMVRRGKWLLVLLGTAAAPLFLWLVTRWADAFLFPATLVFALALLPYLLLRDRLDPLLLLSAFVLFSAPRILLRYYPLWYGFYLLVPAYPFMVYLLGVRLPRMLPSRRFAAIAMGSIGIVIMFVFQETTRNSYSGMESMLVTPKGRMRDFPIGRAEAIADFLTYVEPYLTDKSPSLVVFPEGVSLNYFTGMRNPTAYYSFIPPEIDSRLTEQKMLRELQSAEPDFLVVTSRDLREFGRKGFGMDYALDIWAWITRAYTTERVFEGSKARSWRMTLLRKRRVKPLQRRDTM